MCQKEGLSSALAYNFKTLSKQRNVDSGHNRTSQANVSWWLRPYTFCAPNIVKLSFIKKIIYI